MSTKRALKRKRANERKKELAKRQRLIQQHFENEKSQKLEQGENEEIEYITKVPEEASEFEYFKEIFSKFAPVNLDNISNQPKQNNQDIQTTDSLGEFEDKDSQRVRKAPESDGSSESEGEQSEEDDRPRLSNKKRKLRDRLSISQLKQVVERPDLVELHDPNSADPTLLIHLKSTRNTVAVPEHWMDKRRYLQGKRGFEKASFTLPKAIQDTGVTELRNLGKMSTLKQKQRQRMNPKLGRLDVDYQKLHAAFFKHMEKSRMTSHGDVYYMGKENEVKYRRHRPGMISKRLKNALHMMDNAPPPYLINMQRFGPPPSYAELKIPGLNSPIPPGCKYGYGESQWGKPPVDESGYPLYGDPFGINSRYVEEDAEGDNRFVWGAVEENIAYEEDFEDEEMEEEEGAEHMPEDESTKDELVSTSEHDGTRSEDSTVNGLKTPEMVALRKNIGIETPETPLVYEKKGDKKQLYQVLNKKESSVSGKSAMGSSHTYNISADENKHKALISGSEKVAVALNEEELASLDEMTIRLKYEQVMNSQKKSGEKEDLKLAREGSKRKKGRKKKDELVAFKF